MTTTNDTQSTTFDFNPMYGGVLPAHQHINPDGSEGGWVADNATVGENVTIAKSAAVTRNAKIGAWAKIGDGAKIGDEAEIGADAKIGDGAEIGAGAKMIAVKPITLVGLRYLVTFTDTHIAIACQYHTFERWESFSDAQIMAMDHQAALDFWRDWKPTIMAIARKHEANVKTVEEATGNEK